MADCLILRYGLVLMTGTAASVNASHAGVCAESSRIWPTRAVSSAPLWCIYSFLNFAIALNNHGPYPTGNANSDHVGRTVRDHFVPRRGLQWRSAPREGEGQRGRRDGRWFYFGVCNAQYCLVGADFHR